MSQLFCGAAKRNICPKEEWFPFGMSIVGAPFGGVTDPIYVRAIAVKAGEKTALILCYEMGGPADGTALLSRIQERFGISPEYVMMPKTHTHTAPFSYGNGVHGQAYIQLVDDQTIAAVEDALSHLQPAKMGFIFGKSYINVNRNQNYEVELPDGSLEHHTALGVDFEGVTDKTLTIARFDTLDGKPIAFFLNHPTHATVFNHTNAFDGLAGISGDFPGITCGLLEKKFEGSIALWCSGAAGDQNPLWSGAWIGPMEDTGRDWFRFMTPDSWDLARNLAAVHYNDIRILNRRLETTTTDVEIYGAVDMSVTPGRKIIYKEIDADVRFGPPEVVKIEPEGGTYEIDMQLLCIGDLSLIGVGGELYSSLGLNLKEKAHCPNPVIVTHNGVRTVGYILDDDGIKRKCHGYENSAIRPGYVQDSLVEVTNRMYDSFSK